MVDKRPCHPTQSTPIQQSFGRGSPGGRFTGYLNRDFPSGAWYDRGMDQLLALMWLRWLQLKSVFRQGEGFWAAIGALGFIFLLAPAALGLAIGAGVLGTRVADSGQFDPLALFFLHVLFGANFFAYQLTNLFDPQRSEGLDLRRLQRFPIPLSRLYFLNLAASANDPVFLFFIPSQLALLGGMLGQTGWRVCWAAAAVVLFNVLNLAWSQLIALWIGRFTRARWRKELLVLLLPLLGILVFWMPFWWVRVQAAGGAASFVLAAARVSDAMQWLPPGWAVGALEKAAGNQSASSEMLLLAALAWIGYALGLRTAQGDLLNRPGGRVVRRAVGREDRRRGLLRRSEPLGEDPPGVFGALLRKEFYYLIRSSQGRYAFVWPVIFLLLLKIYLGQSVMAERALEQFEVYCLLSMTGFILFFFLPFYVDRFGYDHGGVALYYFAPVSMKSVLLAKNLAVLALGGCCFAESAVLYCVILGRVPILGLAQAFLGLVFGLLLLQLGGNVISCRFPKSLKMGAVRGSSPPQIAVWLGLAMLLGVSVLIFTPPIIGHWTHGAWAVVLEAGLAAVSGLIYLATIDSVARLVSRRGESLIEALAKIEIQE